MQVWPIQLWLSEAGKHVSIDIAMAYTVMALIVMTNAFMACMCIAYIGMAYIVMAFWGRKTCVGQYVSAGVSPDPQVFKAYPHRPYLYRP